MKAVDALFEAKRRGATFSINGQGQIKVSAMLPLPQLVLDELREQREEIINLLLEKPDYTATACNCGTTVGGTGSERCGVCGLALMCPNCSRCRGCKLRLRFGSPNWRNVVKPKHKRRRK